MPEYVAVYRTQEDDVNSEAMAYSASSDEGAETAAAGISISKTKYYDGKYFDVYDRYVVDGPSKFNTTYSKKSTANWNTSMGSSVTVGADIFTVANVKAAVSNSMGFSIGVEYTKSSSYSINIPAKKYWEIKVWNSFLVYDYNAKVGNKQIASGKCWYPNGLIIVKTEYNK